MYDRTMMLLHALDAAALSDADRITAIVPYFPGARQDKRKGRVREGISAGLFARCMQASGACRIVTLEIHNEAIAGMFSPRTCILENLVLHTALAPWLAESALCGQVVASPDVGGLERARSYAEDLDQRLVVLSKVRDYSRPNRIVVSTLIGDVANQDVLLVDDIVDTGGSVVAAVEQLKAGGARDITVTCAHPLFSGPAWHRLETVAAKASAEGWTFRVIGTNAVDHQGTPDWYHTFDIAPLLARVIASINKRDSVTHAHAAKR
jgi:ribose-phosphate pyrophosphokinase